MSNSYQAIYDAAREAFDISYVRAMLQQDFSIAAQEMARPFVLLRSDGNAWCALYGDNIQEGVCGFGSTPHEAAADFDKSWYQQKPAPNKDA